MAIHDDPVRAVIRRRLGDLGLDMANVSREAGRNHAYLHQFLTQGKPQSLPEDVRAALAARLGVAESDLRGPGRPRAPRQLPVPNATLGPAIDIPPGASIPVYGQAVGGPDGRFVFNGAKIDDVLAPPMLRGVRDAYAVYVAGKSMEPRYRAGETAYVHPHLPVRQGDFVIVQIRGEEEEDPAGYVKEFVSMDDRRLKLKQLNPKKTLEFPRKRVISVHRIVLAG